MLIFGDGTRVEILMKNGADYELSQKLPDGINGNGLALSPDEKELALCSSTLIIYRHNGVNFVRSQIIPLSFPCNYVYYVNNLVEVHGGSSLLGFYKFEGTQYVHEFNIQTN